MPDMNGTLVDRYGRYHTYLRISVTDRCNLRCLYCMPEEESIVWRGRDELLTFEEIERVVRVTAAMGIEKVRLTGGEPLVRRGVEELAARIKGTPGIRAVALTTNGLLLRGKLPALRDSIDALNISLDTFRPDRFHALTGRDRFDDAMAGITAALAAGYGDGVDGHRTLKINAVVMRGVNDDELVDFARFAMENPVAVRFIEFMPFAGNDWSEGKCVPMIEIMAALEKEYRLERLPDEKSPISRDFRLVRKADGRTGRGTVGIIASMTQPFCADCSRLRLTAEGKVMPCLHSPLEFDLRDIVRNGGSDRDIGELFLRALDAKPQEHPDAADMVGQGARVMIQIGG